MITINIRYYGENDSAKKFANEMISTGIVDEIRKEKGNLKYEYFLPMDNSNYVLLIDCWENQEALDKHHNLPVMQKIIQLREKYNLRMEVEKFIQIENSENDKKFIKR